MTGAAWSTSEASMTPYCGPPARGSADGAVAQLPRPLISGEWTTLLLRSHWPPLGLRHSAGGVQPADVAELHVRAEMSADEADQQLPEPAGLAAGAHSDEDGAPLEHVAVEVAPAKPDLGVRALPELEPRAQVDVLVVCPCRSMAANKTPPCAAPDGTPSSAGFGLCPLDLRCFLCFGGGCTTAGSEKDACFGQVLWANASFL